MFRHYQIWTALDRLADINGLSPSGLARKAGLDATAFNKSKRFGRDGRERWPSTESLAKVLHVTKTDFLEFGAILKPESLPETKEPCIFAANSNTAAPILPQAGFFENGSTYNGNKQKLIPLPDGQFEGNFAYRISDNSMLPVYRENDIVVISSKTKPHPGDRVVIKTEDGEIKVRVLLRSTADTVTTTTFNSNMSEEIIAKETLEWVRKITWASQ